MTMNKVLVLVAALLFSGYTHLNAQEPDITIRVLNASESSADGSIQITINSGTPPFTVYLFDKAPWKGGTGIKKLENINSREVSFDELLPGDYYIIVEDGVKNPVAKAVSIGIIPNN